MVGVLIAFCINNIVWAILLVYIISLVQNKSLPRIFPKKTDPNEETEFEEATDEQISKHLDDLQTKAKQFGFDQNGTKIEVGEEKAVD